MSLFDHIFPKRHTSFFSPRARGHEFPTTLSLFGAQLSTNEILTCFTTHHAKRLRHPHSSFDPSSFAHTVRFTLLRCYSDFNSAWILTAVLRRGFTTFSHQRVHISDVSCGLNILACSSNCSRLPSLEFQPPLHHGRTVAAILLEPLPHAAATTSAADLHRRRHHKPFHQPPVIQSYRHLWSSHPRSSHSPHAPHTTLHTIAAAQSIPADSTFAARVSTTTTPATPHHGASHPARPIFQTQPAATEPRWPHFSTSTTTPCPISQTHHSRVTTIGIPTPSTDTSSTEQSNLPNGHGRPALLVFLPLTFSPGNSHITVRPNIPPAL